MQARVRPLASIITVVFNAVSEIEETFKSVEQCKTDETEYIVIDGGSTDGTLDVIKRYQHVIDHWESELDKGIYDAINKGIQRSHGYFVYVLNAGDRLLQFPEKELMSAKESGIDVATFTVKLGDGRLHRSRLDYRSKFANTVHHQGAFYRSDLNIVYDIRFRVFADFDLNQRLIKQNKTFVEYPGIVTFHDLAGISNDRRLREEYFAIIRQNFGSFWEAIGRFYIHQGELRQKIRKVLTAR